MSLSNFRMVLACVAFLGLGAVSRGGLTSFTERGQTDFDTALEILNAYGTWAKIDGLWAYTPTDHLAPYTDGRWIYTEYGWYWKGNRPHSWATEHYGYWKRSADKVWSWYPGPVWLPQTVEIRQTPDAIGWRSAAVDEDGNFIEAPIDRYSKPDEWTFVTRDQFTRPITPGVAAKVDQAREWLDVSTDSMHTYLTYREIDRPGPHPADFVTLARNGGMFPPRTAEDAMAEQPAPHVTVPGYTPSPNAPPAGTHAPALLGTDTDPSADTRQVKYWITMSLPSYWTPPPSDAKPKEIYLYRPDFYQDQDGIERRITLWFNPNARTRLQDVIGDNTPETKSSPPASGAPALPAVPASAEEEAPSHNPFRSPFDDSFSSSNAAGHTQSSSSKTPAPSGLNATNAPAPNPATNAAP